VEPEPVDDEFVAAVESFESAHIGYFEMWRAKLAGLEKSKKNAVVWGAGSKGVMFANAFDSNGAIDYVVDINPKKHGMFIAGSGQRIVPPSFLATHPPDVVIVANPVYMGEISDALRELGITADMIPM
jgi:threonine dehydrogenase-like Zn-dependent dehydrogenase